MPRLDVRAVALMVLLCLLWGVQQVASKVALSQGMPPITQALLRSAVAGPLLLAWLGMRGGRRSMASLVARDGTLGPGLLAALGFALEFILLFEGVQRSPASRSVVLLYTAAFFTAAGTHLLVPGERLRAINGLGFLLAFAGVAVTIGPAGGQAGVGDLLVLGAAMAWGLTTVLVKASPALARISAEKVLAYQVIGAIPILFAAWLWSGEPLVPVGATPLAWASFAYQAVGITFGSYLTWFWLIGRYPAGRLAAFSFLTPLFGVLAASVLLGEPLTASLLLGLAGVGAGLMLVNR